jgi:hypothetical protein
MRCCCCCCCCCCSFTPGMGLYHRPLRSMLPATYATRQCTVKEHALLLLLQQQAHSWHGAIPQVTAHEPNPRRQA